MLIVRGMPSTYQSELTKPYANIYELKTLLLVDDDRQLAETLQWILASENFLVEVAHNGNEAMAKISTNHYDAVVCDIMMPQMKGDDFFRQATSSSAEAMAGGTLAQPAHESRRFGET